MSERRRAASVMRMLCGILAALVIGLLSGELFVRWSGVLDRSPVPRRLLIASDDARLSYRLRPGESLQVLGQPVRVNRLGLRGAELAGGPRPGVERLVVLGDSVVFGWGLAEEESLPVQLQAALRERGREVEVLNAGVPGYNTEAALVLLRELGPVLEAQAVVLGVSLNDFDRVPELSPLGFLVGEGQDLGPSWLANHSELYTLLRWRGPPLLANARRTGHADADDPEHEEKVRRFLRLQAIRARERFYASPSGEGWDRIQRSLRELRDLCAASELDLAVLIFPEEDQLGLAPDALAPQTQWASLCESLRLRCLDLHGAFASAEPSAPLFSDLQHPSAHGMRLAAQAAASWLVR